MTKDQKDQRIAELEKALKPFADLAVTVDGCADYAVVHIQAHVVRRAASLLSEQPETGELADSYLYHNPDSGWEISANHPVDSGEVPDADHIEPISAQVHNLLTEAWSRPDTPQAHGDVERVKEDASLFNLVFPDGPPKHSPQINKHVAMHYTIWQKAIAKAYRLDPWLGDFLVWTAWHRSLQANREQMFIDEMTEAKAALSAMRPAIDREKLAEIRRAYDEWRGADTLCGLLADPEDEGTPSEKQEAAEHAAWAWDHAAGKFMQHGDWLLSELEGVKG